MGFTKFTKNVLNVSALPDRVQNQASSLKLVFDQAGVDIKAALNALISELEAKVAAANIGADVASVTEKNVQGILTAFENEIANRYTKAETNNAILADTNELIADVKIDLATGLLTVTKKNGTKQTFETSTEAESYAVGGTGTRPGEDTDNAKYYAQIAKQVAGGDFVTVVEMEGYAQKKGLYPNYNDTELKGEVIETETTLEAESVLKVHGNSEQATRSGKNLLKKSSDYKSKESDGITFTVNNDESVTINGKNGGNYNSAIYLWNSSSIPLTLPAGTYNSSTGHDNVTIEGFDGTKYYILNSGSKKTFTLDEDVSFRQIYLQIVKGLNKTFDNVTVYPIVTKSTDSVEPYEPYGASPSPEFESPIMSVKSKSDNILKLFANSGSVTNAGVTVEMIDYNTVKLNGTATKDAWVELLYKFGNDTAAATEIGIPLENIKYTASCFISSGSINKAGAKIAFVTTDGTTEYQCAVEYGRQKVFDGKNGLGRIFISLGNGVTYNNLVIKLQVNKGAVALPYRPYGYVPVEARVEGKNKMDLNECVLENQGTTANATTHSVINSNKLVVQSSGTWNRVACTLKGLKPNTSYIVSSLIDNPNGANCGLYGKGGVAPETSTAKNFRGKLAKDTDYNGELYFEFYTNWGDTSVTSTITYDEIQVEEGVTMTPYEQYKLTTVNIPLGDIELRSTPDGTRDTFARVDGVWNKVNNIGVFDCGHTGNWNNQAGSYDTETRMLFSLNTGNYGVNRKYNTRSLCNYFTETIHLSNKPTVQNAAVDVTAFNFHQQAGYENHLYFKLEKSLLDTQDVAGFQKWLENNPTKVIYVLATPTYTPITDQALISALDELEQLILHKGYNRITVTGVNGIKAYLELEISPTALTTNVTETEASTNMIVPVVSETGDVRVKIPATENQMTINPATGVVNVKGLTINGVSLDAYIRSIIG